MEPSRTPPRRRFRIFILAVGSLLGAYGLVCALRALEVKRFREWPTRSVARDLFFGGDYPHQVLSRALVMIPGSEAYEQAVRVWIYPMADTLPLRAAAWNRAVLERDLLRMDDSVRSRFLPLHSLPPSGRLRSFLEQPEVFRSGATFRYLLRHSSTRELAERWIREHVWRDRDLSMLQSVLLPLASDTIFSVAGVLTGFASPLSQAEVDALSAHLGRTMRWRWGEEEARKERLQRTRRELVSWAAERLDDGSLKPSGPLVAALTDLAWDTALAARVVDVLDRHHRAFDDDAIGTLGELPCFFFPDEAPAAYMATQERYGEHLFRLAVGRNDSLAVETLHHFIDCHDRRADDLARSLVLDAPDSNLRKGLIVVLANHGTPLGQRLVDETFGGDIPRRTMLTLRAYAHSATAREYGRFAGHDYMEVGKQWPPAPGGPAQDQPGLWEAFIRRNPWFPGTDDAIYRLVYDLYRAEEDARVIRWADRYFEQWRPDTDATPYVVAVLRRAAARSPEQLASYPELAAYLTIKENPLLDLVEKPDPPLEILEAAVATLGGQLEMAPHLLRPEELEDYRRLLGIFRSVPPARRPQAVRQAMGHKLGGAPPLLLGWMGADRVFRTRRGHPDPEDPGTAAAVRFAEATVEAIHLRDEAAAPTISTRVAWLGLLLGENNRANARLPGMDAALDAVSSLDPHRLETFSPLCGHLRLRDSRWWAHCEELG